MTKLEQLKDAVSKMSSAPWTWDEAGWGLHGPDEDRPIIETDNGVYGPRAPDRIGIAALRNSAADLLALADAVVSFEAAKRVARQAELLYRASGLSDGELAWAQAERHANTCFEAYEAAIRRMTEPA